ncbi:helix-turn-helix domain-containing protein [Streptomyces sp. NPDC059010]|uniref:helix-turn-helix domain-containing protein n=1 Tax=Streptomyces sp. NPDC059010 TaxID=3346695 RepID=UPI00367E876B
MDTQNPSAPTHPQSRIAGKNHPHAGGLIHDNARHTTRFTVIGNHLAQHPELSGLAIGLAVYIQSLPSGARVDIKTLAARFPEGATRIAAALRELETHGYLRRERKRVPNGRIVTRTISCNQPGSSPAQDHPAPPLLQTAADLLAGLRHHDPRLLLSERDTAHLAPGVAAWLERDVTPTAVRHTLTTGLPPGPLCRPAALLAHRLTTQLPPPPPFTPPPAIRHPLQTCDGFDRAFRSPAPGRCRDCRTNLLEAA